MRVKSLPIKSPCVEFSASVFEQPNVYWWKCPSEITYKR